MRGARLRGTLAVGGTAAVISLAAAASATALPDGGRLPVLGFQTAGSSPRLITRSARALTLVGVLGVSLTGPGQVSAPGRAEQRQNTRARADGLPAVLLVNNWSPGAGGFSEPLAYQTLGNRRATTRAAAAIAREVRRWRWHGVSIDLESLRPRDRAGLTRLASDLHRDLPRGDSLTVCVSARTAAPGYRRAGYSLSGLVAAGSQIVLMTYDQHGPWGQPGPIGAIRWQEAAVRALGQAVPRDRVWLGQANYGAIWGAEETTDLNLPTVRGLLRRWHGRRRWVPAAGEWTARLSNGSILWWAGSRAVARRIRLARQLGLYGVAVWSLGTGDRIPVSSSR